MLLCLFYLCINWFWNFHTFWSNWSYFDQNHIASQNRIAIAKKNRIAKFGEKNRIIQKLHRSIFEKIASQNFLRCDAIGSPASGSISNSKPIKEWDPASHSRWVYFWKSNQNWAQEFFQRDSFAFGLGSFCQVSYFFVDKWLIFTNANESRWKKMSSESLREIILDKFGNGLCLIWNGQRPIWCEKCIDASNVDNVYRFISSY